jgi:hypothetical protein
LSGGICQDCAPSGALAKKHIAAVVTAKLK